MKKLYAVFLVASVLIFFPRFAFCELEVMIDKNKDKDFSQYKTFAWLPDPLWEKHKLKKPMEGIYRVVTESVNEDLIAKGYREVPVEEADLVIVCTNSLDQQDKLSDLGYKLGLRKGQAYYGSRIRMGQIGNIRTIPASAWDDRAYRIYYSQGQMMLDFYERKTKELVWRGTGIKTVETSSPILQIEEQKLSKAVKEILIEFPPVKVDIE